MARATAKTFAIAINRSRRACEWWRRGSTGAGSTCAVASADQRADVSATIAWNGCASGRLPNGRPSAKAPSPSVHACSVECAGVCPVCVVQAAMRRGLFDSTWAAAVVTITAKPYCLCGSTSAGSTRNRPLQSRHRASAICRVRRRATCSPLPSSTSNTAGRATRDPSRTSETPRNRAGTAQAKAGPSPAPFRRYRSLRLSRSAWPCSHVGCRGEARKPHPTTSSDGEAR